MHEKVRSRPDGSGFHPSTTNRLRILATVIKAAHPPPVTLTHAETDSWLEAGDSYVEGNQNPIPGTFIGDVVSFVATDNTPDGFDVTGLLWSNTVTLTIY